MREGSELFEWVRSQVNAPGFQAVRRAEPQLLFEAQVERYFNAVSITRGFAWKIQALIGLRDEVLLRSVQEAPDQEEVVHQVEVPSAYLAWSFLSLQNKVNAAISPRSMYALEQAIDQAWAFEVTGMARDFYQEVVETKFRECLGGEEFCLSRWMGAHGYVNDSGLPVSS